MDYDKEILDLKKRIDTAETRTILLGVVVVGLFIGGIISLFMVLSYIH